MWNLREVKNSIESLQIICMVQLWRRKRNSKSNLCFVEGWMFGFLVLSLGSGICPRLIALYLIIDPFRFKLEVGVRLVKP